MIASVSLESYQKDTMSDYINGRTHIWAVSNGIDVEGVSQRPHLQMNSELQNMYDELVKNDALRYEVFKDQIVPKYFEQLMGDLAAMDDIHEIALAAKGQRVGIALMGECYFEFLCVRSIIIGLLQGAGILKKYTTDCFDNKPDDYSEFFHMAPIQLQNTLIEFKNHRFKQPVVTD